MRWQIKVLPAALRTIRKLDPPVARRIMEFLDLRVAPLENPRSLGAALQGEELGQFWKYRVGDYRIIAKIEDHVLCIVVVKLGNRREVYR